MTAMFKKPKRNFRSRQTESESDDESSTNVDTNESAQLSSSCSTFLKESAFPIKSTSNRPKCKQSTLKTVSSANSVLSFVSDDEEGETFQVKKPSHSKRIVKQLKKESQRDKDDISSTLKSDTCSDIVSVDMSRECGVNGELRDVKVERVIDKDQETVKSETESSDDDDESAAMHEILRSGQIPDASLIHMARKRRQLARERADDFIPVDGVLCGSTRDKPSSRLIRDDDDDRSDDSDVNESFAITGRHKDIQRRHIEETMLAAAEENHSDASDQEHEWEEQQIRKGVNIPAQPVAPISTVSDYYQSEYAGGYTSAATMLSNIAASVAGVRVSATDPPRDLPVITVDAVRRRLTDQLSEMCRVHRVHTHERDDMCSRAELSCDHVAEMTTRTSSLEEQYKFFQETRGYVRDLVECLNEKMTSINFLERCITKLLRERAERLTTRRQDDVKDQSLEYLPGNNSSIGSDNVAGDDARKRRRADREGRRARRKRMREAFGVSDHCDGMSTDDEQSTLDANKFNNSYDDYSKSAKTLFDDVIDDFCRVELVLSRFESWKTDYTDSYNEAFIGLCLPKLFTPFAKLELVCWNPLEANCAQFESSRWYTGLVSFGDLPETTDSVVVDDADIRLLPSIVEKVVVPKLTGLVQSVWDPLSLQQTRRLAALVRRLVDEYPTVHADSKPTQVLMSSIVQRIQKTLDDDIFIPLYPRQILENRTCDAAIFFNRQFWTCVKLLQSIVEWQQIISQRQLMELACNCLINRYLVVALQNTPPAYTDDLLTKCQAIVRLVPQDWLSDDSTAPHLENLCRCFVTCATAAVSSDKPCRELLREIVRLLLALHARNHAVSLAQSTQLATLNK